MNAIDHEREAFGGASYVTEVSQYDGKTRARALAITIAAVVCVIAVCAAIAVFGRGDDNSASPTSTDPTAWAGGATDTQAREKSIEDGAQVVKFNLDSTTAAELLKRPAQNPQTIILNDPVEMYLITPLNAGDMPSDNPFAYCPVRYGGSFIVLGEASDGRALVHYAAPTPEILHELNKVPLDPYGFTPPFMLPCVGGEMAFVDPRYFN